MSSRLQEPTDTEPRSSKTWMLAAAIVLGVAALAAAYLLFGGSDPEAGPEAEALELTAAGEDATASCIVFSTEELAEVAEVAFEGTVTSINGPEVTFGVDHWFKGGPQQEVVMDAPEGMEALIGGIPFVEGQSYLITAQGGSVNYCGFSGPSSTEYRQSFEEAFGA